MYFNLVCGCGSSVVFFLLCSRFVPQVYVQQIILGNLLLSFFCSLCCFYEVGLLSEPTFLPLFVWLNVGLLKISIILFFDSLTIVMVLLVLFISTLVHLYSFSYMRHDPHVIRFLCYLSLFTFFMLVLVTANNFLQLLIGWEGVGLTSYLLICFWYTRIAANLAALKAMIVNRIGDICLLFVIFLIYLFFGNLNFGLVFQNVIYVLDFYFDIFFFEIRFMDFLCFFILLGAMGKSAQLLFHIWLPDAMEGPTPVSALIHAATMVTAGVFLIIRCCFFFEYSNNILCLILVIVV